MHNQGNEDGIYMHLYNISEGFMERGILLTPNHVSRIQKRLYTYILFGFWEFAGLSRIHRYVQYWLHIHLKLSRKHVRK